MEAAIHDLLSYVRNHPNLSFKSLWSVFFPFQTYPNSLFSFFPLIPPLSLLFFLLFQNNVDFYYKNKVVQPTDHVSVINYTNKKYSSNMHKKTIMIFSVFTQ